MSIHFYRHAAPISTEQLTLRHVFPEILYPPLFGSTEFTTQSAAAFRRSARVPMIYVYIVSTNEKNESILGSIFHGIPCLLYKLSARDFFPDDNDATTTAVHLYPTLGVDRVVNIAAAQALRPEASAILVLDGGTALTFTTLQPKDIPPTPFRDETDPSRTTTTKSPEMQLTGGIAPGLRLKFSALHDYTNDLPLVTHHQLAAVLDECQETHVSMSVFQSPILDQNTDNNDVSSTDPLSSSQQAKAIIASIMTESALFLCSIVRGWMARVQSQPRTTTTTTATSDGDLNKRLPFLVTCGGDGEAYMKLLQPMHSHVCKISKANQTLLESGLTIQESDIGGNVGVVSSTEESDGRYGGKKFCLLHCNSLPHFGIQQALLKRRQKHAEEHGNEEARFQLVGQRVAVHHPLRKNQIVYGTISEITRRGKTQDEDLYSVVYDETDQIDDLNITTIYGTS